MKNSIKRKKGKILRHLNQGRGLSGIKALRIYNVYRLSSTIQRLRSEGHDIATVERKTKNSEMYAEYFKRDRRFLAKIEKRIQKGTVIFEVNAMSNYVFFTYRYVK